MQLRTWHLEASVVALALFGVTLAFSSDWVGWIGASAVFLTSRHASVADRLREKEKYGLDDPVVCLPWLNLYWVAKEALWLVYFVSLEAWPALVGVALLGLYPLWRGYYRRRIKPLAPHTGVLERRP